MVGLRPSSSMSTAWGEIGLFSAMMTQDELEECDQAGKHFLKYFITTRNWTPATERTDGEIQSFSDWASITGVYELLWQNTDYLFYCGTWYPAGALSSVRSGAGTPQVPCLVSGVVLWYEGEAFCLSDQVLVTDAGVPGFKTDCAQNCSHTLSVNS